MYKNQGKLFWECIISTGGGKGLICSTVCLLFHLIVKRLYIIIVQ